MFNLMVSLDFVSLDGLIMFNRAVSLCLTGPSYYVPLDALIMFHLVVLLCFTRGHIMFHWAVS